MHGLGDFLQCLFNPWPVGLSQRLTEVIHRLMVVRVR